MGHSRILGLFISQAPHCCVCQVGSRSVQTNHGVSLDLAQDSNHGCTKCKQKIRLHPCLPYPSKVVHGNTLTAACILNELAEYHGLLDFGHIKAKDGVRKQVSPSFSAPVPPAMCKRSDGHCLLSLTPIQTCTVWRNTCLQPIPHTQTESTHTEELDVPRTQGVFSWLLPRRAGVGGRAIPPPTPPPPA